MGWQQIATAPKGVPVLVFCPDAREPNICIATLNDFQDASGKIVATDWTDEWAEQDLDVEPTRWMPLPELPEVRQ